MAVKRTSSGAPWEAQVGYCRALRSGDHIYVSGTAPLADDGSVLAPGDAEAQTRRCLEIIAAALADLGARPEHIVRTRMYVTDITRWAEYGRAHAAFFGDFLPAAAMVEVARLIDPDMLIEIEVEALLDEA